MPTRFTPTIDGDDVKIRLGSLTISETLNGRNTLTAEVLSLDASYRPAVGEETIVEDADLGGDRVFGGNIATPSEHVIDDQLIEEFATSISCVDFNAIADRITVIEGAFPAGFTVKQALTSLAGYLAPYGVTVDPAQVDGPVLPLMGYDIKRVSAWFDEISVISGMPWEIDYHLVVRFIDAGTVAAPFNVADGDGNTVGDIVVEPSDVEYANRVIVLAGEGQREVTEALTFNGVDDFIDLTYTLVGHRGYLTVNAVNETLGGSPAIWVFDSVVPNRIKREAGAPSAGTGEIIYTAQFPYIAQADDLVAQAGPRGVVDAVIKKIDVFEATLAEALAEGYLARLVAEPRRIRYSTFTPGLHPGQTQTIQSSVRNINVTALITDVVARDLDGETMRYDVTAVEGDLYPGSWRDMYREWSTGGGGASSGASGAVTVISSSGIGGSGTIGSLAQWVTTTTLGDATAVPASLLTGTTLPANIVNSSLTTLGFVTSAGNVALLNASNVFSAANPIVLGSASNGTLRTDDAGWFRAQAGSSGYRWVNNANNTVLMTLTDAGALTLSGSLGHPSYVSQTSNWRISAAGEADFRYLFVDEMHAKSFIADLEQALAGGQIIAKSVAMVSQPFTAPSAGNDTTLWVRDLPSAANMAAFESGDYVVLRSFSRSAGALTIADCVGQVTGYTDGSGANEGQQSWTFTRSGSPGTMAAATVVPVDSIVIDYGVSGNGYYEVNAIDGPYGVNSPYAQVVTWTSVPVAANRSVRARYGNLKGITSVAEYGLWAGKSFSGNQYLLASDTNFELRGIDLKLYDGSTNTVRIDPSVPSFAMGSTLPSAYGTGTGIWMGKDSGAYKFRVGNPSGVQMTWDGSALVIGAWTVGATALTSGGMTLDGAGLLIVGGSLSSTAFRISTLGGAPHKVWIGDASASGSKWYTNENGSMYAEQGITIGGGGDGLILTEQASAPISSPGAGVAARLYMKADKLIVQYNLSGTDQYFYLDLTSGSGTWAFTTSAP